MNSNSTINTNCSITKDTANVNKTEVITQSLPIPEHKIGWIVGKKGSYINQLCAKSGAKITISESNSREFGIVWKYVQISGSGRAVDRAKKLLHIRLDRMEPRGTDQSNSSGEVEDGKLADDEN